MTKISIEVARMAYTTACDVVQKRIQLSDIERMPPNAFVPAGVGRWQRCLTDADLAAIKDIVVGWAKRECDATEAKAQALGLDLSDLHETVKRLQAKKFFGGDDLDISHDPEMATA